jgi:Bacteriophage tail sheath protein
MVQVSYPGVYVVEKPSGVRTITGVATSITAFIGRALRGSVNDPVRIQSYSDYDRNFGGPSLDSTMSYAVQQFFQNGGSDALIVRIYANPNAAQQALGAAPDGTAVLALSSGAIAARVTFTLAANPAEADNITIGGKQYIFDAHPAVAAQGTLTLPVLPADGDTMTIGGKKYTFQTTLTDGNGNIAIGSLAATRANIVAAINLTGTPAQYGASTTVHPTVSAAIVTNTVVLTAKTPGTAGNSITTVETFTPATDVFDGPTLGTTRLGVDSPTHADGHIAVGANVAATQANIVAAFNLSGTPGIQYAAATTLHPTVSAAIVGGNVVFTAKTPGTGGNAIATNSSFASGVFSAATLTGGVNSTPTGAVLEAVSPGDWGNRLRARIDLQTRDPSDLNAFNLEIREVNPSLPPTSPPIQSEVFRNVSIDPNSPLFVDKILENRSKLVRVRTTSASRPDPVVDAQFTGGSDGVAISDNDIAAPALQGAKEGLWSLQKADLFNLLCIPPLTRDVDIGGLTRTAAAQYCQSRRALFVVDPLSDWDEPSDLTGPAGIDGTVFGLARSSYAALFFPRFRAPDPLRDNQLEAFVPCGAVAGIMARTDGTRGVWKAPAGLDATINGAADLTVNLTDGENGVLNPLGVNCLRAFPVIGRVVWGSRTMRGADQLADEYKYLPIRRLALFIEESLYRGTQWVVFEPNDEPLWGQIRLNVGVFMNSLFRQGAFQGATRQEAFFVKCDGETTTQADRNAGIVNIEVGFAPLKPAEFVILTIQQIAGDLN